jgi:hypothetical protein
MPAWPPQATSPVVEANAEEASAHVARRRVARSCRCLRSTGLIDGHAVSDRRVKGIGVDD